MAYTSFFRDTDALNAISEIAIPALAHWRSIRVWDAGCATGEEPFTLAMVFASKLRPFPFRNLDILATDYEESSFPQFAEQIRRQVGKARASQVLSARFAVSETEAVRGTDV